MLPCQRVINLTIRAPFQGNFASDTASVDVDEEVAHYQEVLPTMPLEIPVTFSAGQAMVTAESPNLLV